MLSKSRKKPRMRFSIRQMFKELKNKFEQKSKLVDEQEDVKRLLDEIKHLKLMNGGKEIENIARENKNLQTKLHGLERKEERMSLDEELGSYAAWK